MSAYATAINETDDVAFLRSEMLRQHTVKCEVVDRLADEQDYALKLQKALTSLSLGGSEFFVRHGDGFRADIPASVARINEVKMRAHDRLLDATRSRKASETKLAAAEAALGLIGRMKLFPDDIMNRATLVAAIDIARRTVPSHAVTATGETPS